MEGQHHPAPQCTGGRVGEVAVKSSSRNFKPRAHGCSVEVCSSAHATMHDSHNQLARECMGVKIEHACKPRVMHGNGKPNMHAKHVKVACAMYGTPAGHGPNTYVGLHVPFGPVSVCGCSRAFVGNEREYNISAKVCGQM